MRGDPPVLQKIKRSIGARMPPHEIWSPIMEDLSGGVLSLDHRYEVNAPRPYEGLALRYGGCQQPFSMDVDLWVMPPAGVHIAEA